MADDLHNANDVIRELEGLSISTSGGSYVKMEDVRRLMEKQGQAKALTDAEAEEEPKTMDQARAKAKKFLAEQIGPQPVREPGRAIPATEPQPSSRT